MPERSGGWFAVTVNAAGECADAAAAEAHRQSAHFKQHAVGGLYQKMRDRVREDLVAIV